MLEIALVIASAIMSVAILCGIMAVYKLVKWIDVTRWRLITIDIQISNIQADANRIKEEIGWDDSRCKTTMIGDVNAFKSHR